MEEEIEVIADVATEFPDIKYIQTSDGKVHKITLNTTGTTSDGNQPTTFYLVGSQSRGEYCVTHTNDNIWWENNPDRNKTILHADAIALGTIDDSTGAYPFEINGLDDNSFLIKTVGGISANGEIFSSTNIAAGGNIVSLSDIRSRGNIISEGSITAYAFYQESDERLKTFTEDYDINLDNLKNIKTGKFYWNEDENKVINGGVSAQSVEEYFPELVNENEEGIKTVNYDGLAVVAIAAIKKLTERIEQLEEIVRSK